MTRPTGTVPAKDTVLIPLPVLGGPRHVQEDQLGVLGLVKDDAIEPHGRVHPPHVGLVPEEEDTHWAPPAASRAPGSGLLGSHEKGRVGTGLTRRTEHPRGTESTGGCDEARGELDSVL